MRVLVTGGAGFIGSHVVEELMSHGHSVVILDNLRTGSIDNIRGLTGSVDFVKGDVRNYKVLRELAEDVDAIIHLAAVVNVREFTLNPEEGLSINVTGTINVLEAARECGVKEVIFASSAAVYGEPKELPIKEEHPTEPINLYGASKLAGEVIGLNYWRSYGLTFTALRLFNVFGPRMPDGKRGNAIRIFIERALRGEPLIIFGTGKQIRDFVYVKDVARAFRLALEKGVPGIFNVGTGRGTKIIELAERIIELTGSKSRIVFRERRKEDISISIADIEKANRVLGWSPEYRLDVALRETIRAYREEFRL